MTKIFMLGIREDEREHALAWARKHNVDITLSKDILTMENVEQLEGYDGVTISQTAKLDDRIYQRLNEMGIKQIAQRSAGFDMYNLEKATEHGIIISNVPSYSPESVAEYAVTAALQLVRKTHLIEQKVKEQDFRWQLDIQSRSISDLEIAVIGTGRIGKIAAQLFSAFGANVVGYDIYPGEDAKQFLTYKDSVEAAIANADIITLHTPLTADNYHLFNKELFNQVKDGSILINAARGALVDTQALIEALNSGKISGAAIDTYENESTYFTKDFRNKTITDDMLIQLMERPDVILTPHIAFYTDVAVQNLVEGGLDATLSVLNTGTCENRLN